jgi:hypothetical protein
VRFSRVWLVYAVTGGLAVAGAAVSATEVALRTTAVAFGVLAWHIAAAPDVAARLRWPLTGGCVLLAAAALVRQSTYADRSDDLGWFAYGRPGTAELVAMRDATCWWLGRELGTAGVQLAAVVLFTGAVHGLPMLRRRGRTVTTVVIAVVIAAGVAADRWAGIEPWRVRPALCALWPGLLATAVGLTGVLLAGRRADHRWLVVAGTALVAVQAAVTLSDLNGLVGTALALNELIGADSHVTLGMAVSDPGGIELGAATTTAVTLCGPALLVYGTRRAAAGPGREAEPAAAGQG